MRPPLPTYEEAIHLRSSRASSADISSPLPPLPHGQTAHARTGSDGSVRSGSLRSSPARPCLSQRNPCARTRPADPVQHNQNNRRVRFFRGLIPQKPVRKFPPILENGHPSSTKHFYGSCETVLDSRDDYSAKTLLGSTPNISLTPRNRNSCVSLDDEKLLKPTAVELLRYRQLLTATCLIPHPDRLSSPRKVLSVDSLAQQPVARRGSASLPANRHSGHFRGSFDGLDVRSGSQILDYSMPPPANSTKIRTNGSLQHHLKAARQTTTNSDTIPANDQHKVSLNNGDVTDSLSMNSLNSVGSVEVGSESDSGKATSQNSGDGTSCGTGSTQPEDPILLMEDPPSPTNSLAFQPQIRNNDPWKMLPDVNKLPWNESDIAGLLRSGRLQALSESGRLLSELTPYLTQVMKCPFLRICVEITRLSHSNHSRVTKRDTLFACQRILPFSLYLACKTACQQAGAFYASGLNSQHLGRVSKSAQAGLTLDVGKIHGFMIEKKLGGFVHDLAAVYLTAALQTIVEELILVCGRDVPAGEAVSSFSVERKIFNDAEFFGIFQTWKHLQAGRSMTGKSVLPSTFVANSCPVILSTSFRTTGDLASAIQEGSSAVDDWRKGRLRGAAASSDELTINQMHWSSDAMSSLQFFLSPDLSAMDCIEKDLGAPLIEWLRVVEACSAYRRSTMVEKEDVMEAARILLPGGEYPPHLLSLNDELQYFQAITKPRFLNDFNQAGLTPLMVACIRGDFHHVRQLLSAGAKVNLSVPCPVPSSKPTYTRVQPDIHHWTALHFAIAHGNSSIAKFLLDNGAWVEGTENETAEMIGSETPLQMAAAAGADDLTALLLAKGADPCLGTVREGASFGAEAQKGVHAPVVLAAAHGRRGSLLRILTSLTSLSDETISLEEMLQEVNARGPGTASLLRRKPESLLANGRSARSGLSKEQMRILQTALFHAAENGFLDAVVELMYFGAQLKAHTWCRSITLIRPCQRAILEDFLRTFPSLSQDDLLDSPLLLTSVLPFLLQLCHTCHSHPVILSLLHKTISHIFGQEPLPALHCSDYKASRKSGLKMNDPRTADVVLRVGGASFYGHKEVLRGCSAVLGKIVDDGGIVDVPVGVDFEDFCVAMRFLYQGPESLDGLLTLENAVQLTSVAHKLAIPSLLRYCERVSSGFISTHSVWAIYSYSKEYSLRELTTLCEGFILQNLVQFSSSDMNHNLLCNSDVPAKKLLAILTERVMLRRQSSKNARVLI